MKSPRRDICNNGGRDIVLNYAFCDRTIRDVKATCRRRFRQPLTIACETGDTTTVIVERTDLFIDEFVNLLDQNGLIA